MEKAESHHRIAVEPELYSKLEELAKNKSMTVDQYADFLFKDATTFDYQSEEVDPSIELPLTAEQYTKLRSWLDANDFIEVYTHRETKVTLINSRQLWRKNHPDWTPSYIKEIGEPVQLNIMVISHFVDFIKEYTRFFGSKDTLETFCMEAIYDKVRSLNGDLEKFARTHGLNTRDWLERFNERTHGPGPDEENDC